jgi:hypothetical protein
MRALVVAALWLAACGDCASSSDIQVKLNVPAGLSIAKLEIQLSLDGLPPRSAELVPKNPLTDGDAFLLRPDPTPSDSYNVALSVRGLDSSGAIVAFGTAGGMVLSNGCNRLDVALVAMGPVDMRMPDLTGVDLATADLAPVCTGSPSGPDEDGDGIINVCDRCPADYETVVTDTDGDNLPDACDPDPSTPGNASAYFEPFDVDNGHFGGTRDIMGGQLVIDTQASDTIVSPNATDTLPANVQVEAWLIIPSFHYATVPEPPSHAGVFLSNNPNPSMATSGALCILNYDPTVSTNQTTLQIQLVGGSTTSTSLVLSNGTLYRLRLAQRGTMVRCEAEATGFPTAIVTAQASVAPTGPMYMAVHARNVLLQVNSLFAATTLP